MRFHPAFLLLAVLHLPLAHATPSLSDPDRFRFQSLDGGGKTFPNSLELKPLPGSAVSGGSLRVGFDARIWGSEKSSQLARVSYQVFHVGSDGQKRQVPLQSDQRQFSGPASWQTRLEWIVPNDPGQYVFEVALTVNGKTLRQSQKLAVTAAPEQGAELSPETVQALFPLPK